MVGMAVGSELKNIPGRQSEQRPQGGCTGPFWDSRGQDDWHAVYQGVRGLGPGGAGGQGRVGSYSECDGHAGYPWRVLVET